MHIEPPPCALHPEPAGWTCPQCERNLCLACAARRPVGQGHLVVCRGCRSVAEPILLPKAREPYLSLVGGALAYPLSRRGRVILLVSAAVFGVLSSFRPLGMVLSLAALASYLFVVVRTSALGEEDVPEGDDFSHVWDLFATLAKVGLAFALAVVPLVVYVTRVRSVPPAWSGYAADPIVWLCLALGLAWTPLSLLLAAVRCDLMVVVNPVTAFSMFARLGGDAIVATLAFWGFFGGFALTYVLGSLVSLALPIPFLPSILTQLVAMYFAMVAARSLGLLLLARGAELDYGRAADYLEPALRNQEPDLEPQPMEFTADPVPEPELVPLAAPVFDDAPGLSSFDENAFRSLPEEPLTGHREIEFTFTEERSIALEPAAPVATVTEDLMPEEHFVAEVVHRAQVQENQLVPNEEAPVDASDEGIRLAASHARFDLVAKAYRARQGAVEVLSDDELVATADAALTLEDAKTAAHALRRLGRDFPQSPHAADGLVRAAKLMRDALGDAAGAEKLLARVVRTYPETAAAAEAMELLAA